MEQIKTDYRQAGLPAADRIMLAFAVQLTRAPSSVRAQDIQRLRDGGFNDRAILDLVQVAAYFNFVNRISLGLGVELESYWKRPEKALE